MLIDIPLLRISDPLLLVLGGGYLPHKIQQGVYLQPHFNFHLHLDKRAWKDSWDTEIPGLECEYGVCDSVEQFLGKYGAALESAAAEYCIAFTRVAKAEQPADGGWRWHKWGPYVGDGEPTTEYLYNESAFEEVFCFHVYEQIAHE